MSKNYILIFLSLCTFITTFKYTDEYYLYSYIGVLFFSVLLFFLRKELVIDIKLLIFSMIFILIYIFVHNSIEDITFKYLLLLHR